MMDMKEVLIHGFKNKPNEKLAEELHKPIIRKFAKRKVHSPFKDTIWGANLADMQLIRKFNEEIRFLLCVIDVSIKYAWVAPFTGKKGITINNTFQKTLDESGCKPVDFTIYQWNYG